MGNAALGYGVLPLQGAACGLRHADSPDCGVLVLRRTALRRIAPSYCVSRMIDKFCTPLSRADGRLRFLLQKGAEIMISALLFVLLRGAFQISCGVYASDVAILRGKNDDFWGGK